MMILVITGMVIQMTMTTPTMKIPTMKITELGTLMIPNTEFRTIWQTQSLLARNVQHQGDGSRAKVRDPDPFDGTDPVKLHTFIVQLQLSFNDQPRAFAEDH